MSARPEVILKFLPATDLSRGPFGLLGLGATRCDDYAIVEALQRRLREVQSHPEAQSADARSVRDELYAAVAQLRDPEVRASLGQRYFQSAWVSPTPPTEFEEGLPAIVSLDLDERLQDRARRAGESTPTEHRARHNYAAAGVLLLVGTLALGGITAWLISMQGAGVPAPAIGTRPAPVPAAAPTPDASPTVPSLAEAPPGGDATEGPITPLSPAEARTFLDRLRRVTSVDGGSGADEFSDALRVFEQRWTEMPGDVGVQGALAVAERLMRTTRADPRLGVDAYQRVEQPLGEAMLSPASIDADAVAPAAWSAGVLNRLCGDASIPTRLASSARVRVASLTVSGEVPRDHSFAGGVLLVLDTLARRWARPQPDTPESQRRATWRAWLRCAAALDTSEPGASLRAVASGIDELLKNGEPGTQPLSAEAMVMLLEAADWRNPDAAERLLRWFDDPRVESKSLSVLTAWAAGRGPLAGAGASMVLPTDATTAQRAELRGAYAVRLGAVPAGGSRAAGAGWDELLRSWSQAARGALDTDSKTESGAAPLTVLAAAASVARLNEAGARMWAMDTAGASEALRSASADAVASITRSGAAGFPRIDPSVLTSPGVPPDGEWARRWLSSMNESSRLMLMNQLRNGRGPEGPADADVLCQAAYWGAPRSARRIAQQAVRELADRAVVVNGLLESIGDAPRQKEIGDMIADVTARPLPPVSDPSWRRECRRALVELLMSMTGDADDDRADALAQVMGDACRASTDSLRPAPAPGNTGAHAPTPAGTGPDIPARELRELWRDLARRIPEGSWADAGFDELDRRHTLRRSLADGPIQRFIAERIGAAEMMAHVVTGERPPRAPMVRDAMAPVGTEGRWGPSAMHQVLAVERAVLRLWLLRFGEAVP